MQPPSFRPAPLPMLLWAIWPQVTVAADMHAVLLPGDIGHAPVVQMQTRRVLMYREHGLQAVGLPVPKGASRTRAADARVLPADQPAAATVRGRADEEAAAPAPPTPVMMPQPLTAVASLAVPTSALNSTPPAPQSEPTRPAKPAKAPQTAGVATDFDQVRPVSTGSGKNMAPVSPTHPAALLTAAFQERAHDPDMSAPTPRKPQQPVSPHRAPATADIPRFPPAATMTAALAAVDGSGSTNMARFQQASPMQMSAPSAMAPLRGTWWIPFNEEPSPAIAPPRLAGAAMHAAAAQPQPPAPLPIPPQSGLTPLSAAAREAEMLMRASGRWWLSPERVVAMPVPGTLQATAQPQSPTPPLTQPAIRISLPTLSPGGSGIAPVKPMNTSVLSPASAIGPSTGGHVAGSPETPPAKAKGKSSAENVPLRAAKGAPATAGVSEFPASTLPKTAPVAASEKLPSEPVKASPIKEEPPVAQMSGRPQKTLAKTTPAAASEKLPSERVKASPIKEEPPVAQMSGRALNTVPKTASVATSEKLPTRQAESSLPKAALATAAAPEMMQRPQGATPATQARPVLLPPPIPLGETIGDVKLPKSKPVLEPKVVAAIQPQPRQLVLPFPPIEGAKQKPEASRTEASPYLAPQPVVTTDIDAQKGVTSVERALQQIKGVLVPNNKNLSPGPSQFRGSPSGTLKSRKPAHDASSGLFKPVESTVAQPRKVDVPAKIKRMCFEGGELKPCK